MITLKIMGDYMGLNQSITWVIRDNFITRQRISEMETHEKEYRKLYWLRNWMLENTKYDDQKLVKLSQKDTAKFTEIL